MDRAKLKEANRLISLIDTAEKSLERLQKLFDTEEIAIMNQNDGGYVYVNGKMKDTIRDLMIKDEEEWLNKNKEAFDKL